MKTVEQYIDIIFNSNDMTDAKWLELQKEIDEWEKTASEDDLMEMAESGAGEMLDMMCR